MKQIILAILALFILTTPAAAQGRYDRGRDYAWTLVKREIRMNQYREWERARLLNVVRNTRGETIERISLVGDGSDLGGEDGNAYDGPRGFIQQAGVCVTPEMEGIRRDVLMFDDGNVDEVSFRANQAQIKAFEACLQAL